VIQNTNSIQVEIEQNISKFGICCDFRHSSVQVQESIILKNQKSLRATEFIPVNSVIFIFENSISEVRTRTSIQVSNTFHIEAGDFGAFTNHSCNPNARIICECDEQSKTAKVMLVTIVDVFTGNELTFDYATTESTLTTDILYKTCLCNSKNCRGSMVGFNELSPLQLQDLKQKGNIASYLI